jgi:hypothetical protein
MHKTWTEIEKQYIRENALQVKDVEIAKILSDRRGKIISVQSVRKQRQKLGILKASGRGYCRAAEKKVVTNEA